MNHSSRRLLFHRCSCVAGFLIAGGIAHPCLAQSAPGANRAAVENALGSASESPVDSVLTYNITRLGESPTIGGHAVSPNFQFVGKLHFFIPTTAGPVSSANTVWVIGEVPLLEKEVDAFVKTVQSGGLSIDALHSHLLQENPRTVYAHVSGSGDAAAVAATMKTALEATGNIFTTTRFSGGTALNDTTLAWVIRGRMNIVNGVVYLQVPRRDQFVWSGVPVPAAIAPQSRIIMDQTQAGARVAFELALLPSEVAAATKILRDAGLSITAVHNRTTSIVPDLSIVHGSALGDSTAMAVAIRNALNQTNSEGSPKAP